MRKYRFHLIFALCWATGSTLMAWLVAGDDSPMRSPEPIILDFIAMIHCVPFILTSIISEILGTIGPGSTEAIYWGLGFLQWFLAGFLVAYTIRRRKGHRVPNK